MELRVLKYFLTVAREENITRAAKRMHITQPTLSRQLMQLEDELGVKLFKRTKHSILLTEEGVLLRQRAQEMVSIEDKIINDFANKDNVLSGKITIGSGETHSMDEVAEKIASFQKKNPDVDFEIFSGIADDIKIKIENGTVDIGLLTEPVDISRYDFVRMKNKDRWGALMRNDSELSANEYICPENLLNTPLIMAKRESVRNVVENWFGKYYDDLKIAAESDLLYNTTMLVKNNVGIAVCLESAATGDELCFKSLMPPIETGAVLVWKKHRDASPAVREFVSYIKNASET